MSMIIATVNTSFHAFLNGLLKAEQYKEDTTFYA